MSLKQVRPKVSLLLRNWGRQSNNFWEQKKNGHNETYHEADERSRWLKWSSPKLLSLRNCCKLTISWENMALKKSKQTRPTNKETKKHGIEEP
jgi:hypothetical protein